MLKVGVVGARGYMGRELVRILLNHPDVQIAWLAGRNPGHLTLTNIPNRNLAIIRVEDISPCDLVFLATPCSATLMLTEKLLQMGSKVIDLGASFRLKNKAQWESIYGMKHCAWHLQKKSIYGITELKLESIKQYSLIANPGCFSSATILALAPLVQEQIISTDIFVTGLSGSSGMGQEPSVISHHSSLSDNLVAYNVVAHRHSYEMEQELGELSAKEHTIHFTPAYVPIVRGILNMCSAKLHVNLNRRQLLELYQDYYAQQPFVHVLTNVYESNVEWQYQPYPWVKNIAGTNFVHMGLDLDTERGRVLVLSALDNLGKGGAQVAVENMNILFGLSRDSGLQSLAIVP